MSAEKAPEAAAKAGDAKAAGAAAAGAGAPAAAAPAAVWNDQFSKIFSGEFVAKGGAKVSTDELKARTAGGAIGIYFSAHWCGPCRMFTPQLTATYNKLKAEGKPFEVVFVSGDNDQRMFDGYFGSMPWLAVPYTDKARIQKLNMLYKVQGIPSLVIVDSATGATITRNGRMSVGLDKDGAKFPWNPVPARELDGMSVQDINDAAALLLFVGSTEEWQCSACTFRNTDGAQCGMCSAPRKRDAASEAATVKTSVDAKAAADATAAVEGVAKDVYAKFKADGKEADIVFYIAKNDPVVGKVKAFLEVPSGTTLALLDIPNRCKYVWGGGDNGDDSTKATAANVTPAAVKHFYDQYRAGKLKKILLPVPQQSDDDY